MNEYERGVRDGWCYRDRPCEGHNCKKCHRGWKHIGDCPTTAEDKACPLCASK